MINIGNFIDLTGLKFTKWSVIERTKAPPCRKDKNRSYWLCQCDCGNFKIVSGKTLTNGNSKSCGCLKKTNPSRKKHNKFDLTGEYGIGFTFKEEEFYFDLEDYDKIKEYCWHKTKQGYIVTNINNGKYIRLVGIHKFILEGQEIDHINGNPVDNRKSNLRVVSHSQNMMNRVLQKNNTSGVSGVRYIKNRNQWRAEIKINNKTIHLGQFNDIEDAIKVRKEAEEQYFGEYRRIK